MKTHHRKLRAVFPIVLAFVILLLSACGGGQESATPTPTPLPPTAQADLPVVTSIEADRAEVPNYESIELTLGVDANYSNPYDAREVIVDGIFTGPDGTQMTVPGFWDGESAWKMRFTPSQAGNWSYSISVTDVSGASEPKAGEFSVVPSELHGWIIPGNSFDASYSPHYLVYHDGTPFYGIGHCEALNILTDGFDVEDGLGLFDKMKTANENYVVWWPMYTSSIINSSYDDYSIGNMKLIDTIVKDAEKQGIVIVFTVWDHPNIRDDTHKLADGKWNLNGFSKLSDIESFFVSAEPWAWQENLYRYMIARWGYSPAIGMWATVSEISETNAYDQTDPWHEKVNAYFVKNDPYRHPTTASQKGELDWQTGHAVMDMPQVHLYDFDHGAPGTDSENVDIVDAAAHIAEWTQKMLKNADKPNWIGEFGAPGNAYYPELFHNSIWAALSSGASMTPAEWNSGGLFGEMTLDMYADNNRLAYFVKDLPLAKWDPTALQIVASDEQVRGWGIAGQDGGLLWIQDYSLEGSSIDDVRNLMLVRSGVQVELIGLTAGTYDVKPYDTWQGVYLESYEVVCVDAGCTIPLPDFKSDMAFLLIRK